MIKVLLLSFFIFFVSSCSSTFSQSDCINADWKVQGYKDATEGKVLADYADYLPMCQKVNVSPDQTRYEQGYLLGVNDYCTKENGLKKGSKGGGYDKSCPTTSEYYLAFLEGAKAFKEAQERHVLNNLTRPKPDVTDQTGQAGGHVQY